MAFILPGIYSYSSYKAYKEAKQSFYQPVTWQKKCSDNQRYCLYIRTKGNANQNILLQQIILELVDTNNKKLLFSKRSTHTFKSSDLEGYKFNKFIVNRYKRNLVDFWLEDYYFISNEGNLLIIELDSDRVPSKVTFVDNRARNIRSYSYKQITKYLDIDRDKSTRVNHLNYWRTFKPIQKSPNIVQIRLATNDLIINLNNGNLIKQ